MLLSKSPVPTRRGRSPHLPAGPEGISGSFLLPGRCGRPQLCGLSPQQPHLLLLTEYTHSHYSRNSWQ